jgi:outer membrane immunogenic protein
MLQWDQFLARSAAATRTPSQRHAVVKCQRTLAPAKSTRQYAFFFTGEGAVASFAAIQGPQGRAQRTFAAAPVIARNTAALCAVGTVTAPPSFLPAGKNKGVPLKKLRSVVLAAIASVGVVDVAAAADLGGPPSRRGSLKDAPAPVVYERPFSWSGLYVGANLGYGWSDVDWQDGFGPASHDGKGWLAGAQIGYNVQSGQFVFGVEADWSSAWIDGNTTCCGHEFNWLASVRGRAGIAINGNRTLLYGTGGAAWADVDYASTAPGVAGFSNTHFGWVAGGGIEHMLTQNLSARVEYLHYSFDETTGPVGGISTTVEPKLDTVRFGLNVKF